MDIRDTAKSFLQSASQFDMRLSGDVVTIGETPYEASVFPAPVQVIPLDSGAGYIRVRDIEIHLPKKTYPERPREGSPLKWQGVDYRIEAVSGEAYIATDWVIGARTRAR